MNYVTAAVLVIVCLLPGARAAASTAAPARPGGRASVVLDRGWEFRQAGTDAWRPTPAFLLLANLTALPIVNDSTASIRLRFTPHGGDWRIDDVYVDPWKGR